MIELLGKWSVAISVFFGIMLERFGVVEMVEKLLLSVMGLQ